MGCGLHAQDSFSARYMQKIRLTSSTREIIICTSPNRNVYPTLLEGFRTKLLITGRAHFTCNHCSSIYFLFPVHVHLARVIYTRNTPMRISSILRSAKYINHVR